MTQATDGGDDEAASRVAGQAADTPRQRGKTIYGEAANAGHRVLAPRRERHRPGDAQSDRRRPHQARLVPHHALPEEL